MKKLLKFAGLFMLLISSFTFAQYNPGGCIPTPPPLDKLIKEPITNDMFGDPNAKIRSEELSQTLLSFQQNLFKYSSGGTVPQNLIDTVENSTQTAYYQLPQSLIDKSSSIRDLRSKIRTALKTEKNVNMIEFYVGWEYQLQVVENSGLNYQSARFGWGCISSILGGAAVGAGVGAGVGTVIPGIGTAAGAVAGGLIGGTISGIKNCK
ncbi:hypothetical protein ASG31_16680 [Chryseobacterium sp. Leaf404]|uniref:hypothetical protein n=1 Tax=unclassified Chryseobacterium TaxID=2593645 RepID=UPI0007129C44|nr:MULTISPECIES: hypothetical protein [unclassified Chryseobacterium]KQT20821.1 hypothetical protein ASG31_16680 [Chryseobacterium sp. Leaf404]